MRISDWSSDVCSSDLAAASDDSCAALQVHLDIPANGATEVCFVLGQGDDLDRARELVHTWQDPANIEAAASACAAAWDERLSRVQVTTPDPAFDLMVNRWLPHQSISARVRARAGFYQAQSARSCDFGQVEERTLNA